MKFEGGHSNEPPTAQSVEKRRGPLYEHEGLVHRVSRKGAEIAQRETVDPAEYDTVYTPKELEEHELKTKERKESFKNNNSLVKEASDALEMMLYEYIGRFGWLSCDSVRVYVEKTAPTDDIFNGTDLVVTFETVKDKKFIPMAIDVALGVKELGAKAHSVKQGIDKGTLVDIMFHETPLGERGPLKRIPRVVMSVDTNPTLSLFKLWDNMDTDNRERLKTHPQQLALVLQIEAELEACTKYAQDTGRNELFAQFEQILQVIRIIRKEKEQKLELQDLNNTDTVVTAMRRVFFSQLSNSPSEKKLQESKMEEIRRKEITRRLRR